MGRPPPFPPMTIDVIYASAAWQGPAKLNCHFVTECLTRAVPVLYVESVGARAPVPHDWRRVLARLARSLTPLRRVGKQLWVFSPLPLPAYGGRAGRVNSAWVAAQVRVALAMMRRRVDACWVFHPMGLGVARTVRPRATVYYCVDDYVANPGVDRQGLESMQADVVALADVTVVTGEPLARTLRAPGRDVRVWCNVADTELFGGDFSGASHPVLEVLDAVPRPRVGYLGNLAAYKIDLDLVDEIARRRPEWSVVLVGPRDLGDTTDAVGRRRFPANVHLLGPVPHELAPAVVDRFDVCLLPSARHDVMRASFPLKFFEYLLRGKPVVRRPLPALEPYREWLRCADSAEEFVAAVEEAVGEADAAQGEARRRFAAGFGWAERSGQLLALRAELLGEGVTAPEALLGTGRGVAPVAGE